MNGGRVAAALLVALSVGCAGLPRQHKPVQLAESAPLDGLEAAAGGDWELAAPVPLNM